MAEQKEERKEGRKQGQEGGRKPLRATVAELDQEILRLLTRRTNLLNKMRDKGRLPVADEKFLREAWQNDVARVSRDPELSGRFFSLMQQITFLPRPSGPDKSEGTVPGAMRREAFNLAPPQLPIHAALTAPLAEKSTKAWLYLAAASGQPLKLAPCLQNDSLVDFAQGMAQIGAAITREDDAIITRQAPPMPTPDKVIHVGESEFNLYLFVAHYVGRHSRVKFTGGPSLQLADLSWLRQLLPELGARLVNIVPKSDSLPARLESSGILPAGLAPGADIAAEFCEALLLAAPFYESPFALSLAKQPRRESIIAHVLPALEAAGAVFSFSGDTVSVSPSLLEIPAKPKIAIDPELAAFLLAFAPALGGEVQLRGEWADWPENADFWTACLKNGYKLLAGGIEARFEKPLARFNVLAGKIGADWQIPCLAAMLAGVVLHGGATKLPEGLADNPDVADFLRVAGLKSGEDGTLAVGEKYSGLAWNAPSPAWALALALAACSRKDKTSGWRLGNPGIITELWPHFWAFYNSLPDPKPKKAEESKPAPKQRRRIMTDAVAVPPEIKAEDWD